MFSVKKDHVLTWIWRKKFTIYFVRALIDSPITCNYCRKIGHKSFSCSTKKSNWNKNNVKIRDPKHKMFKQVRVPKDFTYVINYPITNHDRIKKCEVGDSSNSRPNAKC